MTRSLFAISILTSITTFVFFPIATIRADEESSPVVTVGVPSEKRNEQIWKKVSEQNAHIRAGDAYYNAAKYSEALDQYELALKKASTGITRLQARDRLALTYEVLGGFSSAIDQVSILVEKGGNPKAKNRDSRWLMALQSAANNQFDEAVAVYQELLATAEDWERPSIKLRLRLMEKRAHAAGQFHSDKEPRE